MEVRCRLRVADALNGVFVIVSDLRRQKGFAVACWSWHCDGGSGRKSENLVHRDADRHVELFTAMIGGCRLPIPRIRLGLLSEPRLESNTAADFLEFVVVLILRGVVVRGDFSSLTTLRFIFPKRLNQHWRLFST